MTSCSFCRLRRHLCPRKGISLIRRQAPPSPIGEGSHSSGGKRHLSSGTPERRLSLALRAFLRCSPIIFPRAGRTELFGGETRFAAGQFRTVGKKPPRGFWRTQSARGKSITQNAQKRRTPHSGGKSVFLQYYYTVGKLLRGFPGTLFSKSAPEPNLVS